MARQDFIQPQGPKRDEDNYQDDGGWRPDTAGAIERSRSASQGAQNSINDIDNLLGQEQAAGSPNTVGDRAQAASTGLSPRGLSQAENGRSASPVSAPGSNWKTNMAQKFQSRGLSRNKKIGIGAGGISLAGLGIGGFMALQSLIPLSIVTNLQQAGFGNAENTSSVMSNNLFESYLVRQVIPGMALSNACNSTRADRSCAAIGDTTSPVGALFAAWRDNNLEGKMAANHGIEIVRRGNNYYLRTNSLNSELDMGTYDANTRTMDGKAFAVLSRTDVRREVKTGFESETLRSRAFIKWNAGRLLEDKYGIRRCVMLCPARDKVADTVANKKNALKLTFIERVVLPRSEMLGLALTCATSNFNCADPGSADNDGERQTQFQKDVKNSLKEYRRIYGENPLNELEGEAGKVREHGVTGYIVRRIAGEATGSVLSKVFQKGIPIAGWIDGANSIYRTARDAGPAIKHMNYVMTIAGAVNLAGVMATNADESKVGGADAAEQGSFAQAFDADPTADQGGAGMNGSPLYQYMFGDPSSRTASITNFLSPQAYAASPDEAANTTYKCYDDQPIAAGQLVCPEVSFGAFSTAAKIAINLSAFAANNPLSGPLNVLSSIWSNTGGAVLNFFGEVFGSVANVFIPDAIKESVIGWIQDEIMAKFFINPLGETGNPAGARKFELSALGFEQMGNDIAQYDQGAGVLTDAQANEAQKVILENHQADFAAKPLYARMFDSGDNYSLISRVALMMPSTSSSALQSIGSLLRLPVAMIGKTFSAITTTKASAAYVPQTSAFGLARYGYPVDAPILQSGVDYDKYWKDNDCDNPDLKKIWGDKATDIDEATGMPIQREAQPCMAIRSAVAASGAKYDTALLQPERTGDGEAAASTPPTGGNTIPSGDTVTLGQQILDNPNITFQTASGEAAVRQFVANGGRASTCGGPLVSPKLLGVLLTLAQRYKLVLGVIVDGHDCDRFYHTVGEAIDINGVNPLNGGVGTGNNIRYEASEMPILNDFYKTAAQVLSDNGGGTLGQKQYITNLPAEPPGVHFINDSKDHLHLDVGDGARYGF